ncbi:hypothetical protein CEXT_88321 [Caerostris extrusa]|uniref:Uncharacterized protein n=1 Tax=Caerostris extrusa TaxID=172846 RepID=A0AAV4UG75_CAEEX|nr:hypothetical protein CEXT_88321 [Caerostris extrusa]
MSERMYSLDHIPFLQNLCTNGAKQQPEVRVRMAQTILIPLARENLPQVNHLTANSHQQLITEDVSLLLCNITKPPQSKTRHTLKERRYLLSAILASDGYVNNKKKSTTADCFRAAITQQ